MIRKSSENFKEVPLHSNRRINFIRIKNLKRILISMKNRIIIFGVYLFDVVVLFNLCLVVNASTLVDKQCSGILLNIIIFLYLVIYP